MTLYQHRFVLRRLDAARTLNNIRSLCFNSFDLRRLPDLLFDAGRLPPSMTRFRFKSLTIKVFEAYSSGGNHLSPLDWIPDFLARLDPEELCFCPANIGRTPFDATCVIPKDIGRVFSS